MSALFIVNIAPLFFFFIEPKLEIKFYNWSSNTIWKALNWASLTIFDILDLRNDLLFTTC
jgi:hypothetical protein